MTQRIFPNTILVTVAALLCGLIVGCGGSGGYRVSGKVTFQGQPVPAGKVYFMPDEKKGNKGATGFADIKDGQYDTGLPGGQGSPGGAVIIAVQGIDPAGPAKPDPSGEITTKLLFARYELEAELPQGESTKDIEVPAEAAKGPPKPKAGEQQIIP